MSRVGGHDALGRLRAGRYRGSGRGSKTSVWRRAPREAALSIPLGSAEPVVRDVPGSEGLQLHVAERPIDTVGLSGAHLPAGTRSVSCFLINRRTPDEAQPDRAYAFQAEIEVRTDRGFMPRPDLRGAHGAEWDDRVADLHYADTPEYATGHGVSAEWELVDGGCRSIRTAWIGTAEVEKTATAAVPPFLRSPRAAFRPVLRVAWLSERATGVIADPVAVVAGYVPGCRRPGCSALRRTPAPAARAGRSVGRTDRGRAVRGGQRLSREMSASAC